MPIPKDKASLLQQSEDNFEKLILFIANLSPDQQLQEFPAGTMNRNIRDVLAHLYHWHTLFFNWYKIGMKGDLPSMPTEKYTWKETKQLNKDIWERYQNQELPEILAKLKITHTGMITIIKNHTDIELFQKKRYKWIGTSCLATYIRSNCSSHYNWAYKLIKKAVKEQLNP